MWEGALVAGIVLVGLAAWLAVRSGRGHRASHDGDSGTPYVFADGGSDSHSAASDCVDTSSDGGCDGGAGGD
ncbi:MAG TPA: hypothetical protein VJ484_11350 [Lysobacter sp.]|nr:hypothetical protein [Lysobacter sp.]